MFTDSHTHLFLDAFDADRDQVIQRAIDAGVDRMLLPNIDSSSLSSLFSLSERFPAHCFPMTGLHPGSVRENYMEELRDIEAVLERPDIVAIGEAGIDLNWDRTFLKEQEEVFATQIRWAMELDLPIVIHARDSFLEIFSVLDRVGSSKLRGVFHSFTGGPAELERALSYNFMIGINGIVTFKNSKLDKVASMIPLKSLLLETDSPFLAPVPYRGKRNESSYLTEIAAKISEIYNLATVEIARITTSNAEQLFRLKPRDEV